MLKVLRKRISRELKTNFIRYFGLFLLIVLVMYIVISVVDAADTVIEGTEATQEEANLEDLQITVFTKLLEDQIHKIEDAGVSVEEHISFDAQTTEGDTLRIFRNRQLIDKVTLIEGRLAENDDEIVVDRRYSEENNINIGDTISVENVDFKVTGIGVSVDYDACFAKMSDTAVTSDTFGIAFVTPEGYDRVYKESGNKAEDLTYAFVLNDAITADELKEMIKNFDFDYKQVDDPYYREMLDKTYGKKDEILDGIDDLYDGVEELNDGATELHDATGEFKKGLLSLHDATSELANNTRGLTGGAAVLNEGCSKVNDATEEAYENAKELNDGAGANDQSINKSAGMACGVILMIMFTYVLSVFVIHQIQNESSVIGALYAMG